MEHKPVITPERFFQVFLKVVMQTNYDLVNLWLDKKPYTKLMIVDCFKTMAERLNLTSWANYYYLDSVFYGETDDVNFPKGVMNAKYFDVALEHEHDIRYTAQEINKLQLFNAPLKVLVTYDECDSERQKYLSHYAGIIGAADIFGDVASRQRQLVIFGRKGKAEITIQWSPFVYKRDGFVPL
jgi:hypothetical protein